MVGRALFLSCLLLSWAGCASPASTVPKPAPTVHDYYPLTAGSAWSYDVTTAPGEHVLAITRVRDVSGSRVVVSTGESRLIYRIEANGIVREPDGVFLLRAPLSRGARWPSRKGANAEVTAVGLRVHTPAGEFEDCVRVAERGGPTGAQVDTTYCPGVGPVEVVSSIALTQSTARVQAHLRGYVIGPEMGSSNSAR